MNVFAQNFIENQKKWEETSIDIETSEIPSPIGFCFKEITQQFWFDYLWREDSNINSFEWDCEKVLRVAEILWDANNTKRKIIFIQDNKLGNCAYL